MQRRKGAGRGRCGEALVGLRVEIHVCARSPLPRATLVIGKGLWFPQRREYES